jgi:hypothetical protein
VPHGSAAASATRLRLDHARTIDDATGELEGNGYGSGSIGSPHTFDRIDIDRIRV